MNNKMTKETAPPKSYPARYVSFAVAWIACGDAESAAKSAGYAPKNAKRQGQKLLAHPDVQACIAAQKQQGKQDLQEQYPLFNTVEGAEKGEKINKNANANENVNATGNSNDTAAPREAPHAECSAPAVPAIPQKDSAAPAPTASSAPPAPPLAAPCNPTAERVLHELAGIAFATLADVCRWQDNILELLDSARIAPDYAAAIAEICETSTSRGSTLRIKMHSKLKALEMLCRALGLFDGKEQTATNSADAAPTTASGDVPPELLARMESLYCDCRRHAAQWEQAENAAHSEGDTEEQRKKSAANTALQKALSSVYESDTDENSGGISDDDSSSDYDDTEHAEF